MLHALLDQLQMLLEVSVTGMSMVYVHLTSLNSIIALMQKTKMVN